MAWGGTLTQFMSRHLSTGGDDSRGAVPREQLIRAGVPVRAKPSHKGGQHKPRWHLHYANR
eukprot:9857069-Lingulodinium_polyedra.AAC.1